MDFVIKDGLVVRDAGNGVGVGNPNVAAVSASYCRKLILNRMELNNE